MLAGQFQFKRFYYSVFVLKRSQSDVLFSFIHLYYNIIEHYYFQKTECKVSCLVVKNGVSTGAHQFRDLVL